METQTKASPLRRKTQAGKQEHEARAMSVPKALRLSLAKLADQRFDLAMSAIGITQEIVWGDGLQVILDLPGLLVLLDGPQGRVGGAIFDEALVGGLIQQQTMGTVSPVVEGAASRDMTATDAAMCAPFLDGLLARAAPLPETQEGRTLIDGYRFGSRAEDARIMQMALEAHEYEVLRLTIDVAAGQRQGQLTLILPKVDLSSKPSADEQVGEDASRAPVSARTLNDTVLELEAELTIALARVPMQLSDAHALVVGAVLPLGVTGLDNMMVLSSDGRVLSRGAMGQLSGVRALRLARPVSRMSSPKRRESDREDLDLPNVDPIERRIAEPEIAETASPNALEALPNLEMPDMSDLEELGTLEDLSEFRELKIGNG
ncbi:FliM/FliN family flagellar motor switch protein [Sulfitobacter sp. SK012]|uniref:FliM/FliN family flagellar motor switch protein n=1 Tax=Sulfitobacter sp. SK012 TaxID=1389005 RepID=UPI0013B3B1AA|nr:FliM/FliN family flagellar motor C-terminal domain-containing protein [Sulfitobacter sp. SK012]